jgi:4-amino-4-deoxy-L-arabinose transferase-like glycosyltransferase
MKIDRKAYNYLLGFIFVLAAVSYTLNIKEPVLIPDESLRALVGLEMHLTGDYITPKLGGIHYYKKPPVFNWVVATYYNLTGDYSEMGTRIPMLLSLFFLAFAVFYYTKKYFDTRTGILAALFLFVSLRILSYETLYGLIDISYSLVVFSTIIYTWQLAIKKKYLLLFLITYFLTAVSFLMKGIPSIAYQGLTLLLVFAFNREIKKLFSWKHLLGGSLFLSILSLYYYLYYIENPSQISILLNTIFNESADKSGLSFGFWTVVKHALNFLVEIIYSFIPASLLVVFLFNTKTRKYAKDNRFLTFLILAFLVNISIYVISPISFMRYVIPHFALLSIPSAASYVYLQKNGESKFLKLIDGFFLIATIAILFGNLAYGFVPQLFFMEYIWMKVIVLITVLAIPLLFLYKKKHFRVELFIIALLVFKLGYNWIIVPSRNHDNFREESRKKSIAAGEMMRGKKAIMYNESIETVSLFYLTAAKRELITFSRDTSGVDYLIGHYLPLDLSDKVLIDSYKIEYFEEPLKIYKLK